MKVATRLTSAGLAKIHRQIVETLKKLDIYSDVTFIYAGNMVEVGSSDFDHNAPEGTLHWLEPKVKTTKCQKPENWGGNPKTITITYDGGPLYSVMNGEYGWSTHEKFMNALEVIIAPYELQISEVNSYTLTFYEGGTPDHIRVLRALS